MFYVVAMDMVARYHFYIDPWVLLRMLRPVIKVSIKYLTPNCRNWKSLCNLILFLEKKRVFLFQQFWHQNISLINSHNTSCKAMSQTIDKPFTNDWNILSKRISAFFTIPNWILFQNFHCTSTLTGAVNYTAPVHCTLHCKVHCKYKYNIESRVDDIGRVSNCTIIAAATAQIVLKSQTMLFLCSNEVLAACINY